MAAHAQSDSLIVSPLRANGLIDASDVEKAKKFRAKRGGLLSEALLRLDLVRQSDFLKVFAELYGSGSMLAQRLEAMQVGDDLVRLINARTCERLRVFPIRWDAASGALEVVTTVPLPSDLEPELRRATGARAVKVHLSTAGALDALIRRWHHGDTAAFADVTPNGAGKPGLTFGQAATEPVGLPANSSEERRDGVTVMVSMPQTDPQAHARTQSAGVGKVRAKGALQTGEHPSLAQLELENARHRIAQDFSRRLTQERSRSAMVDRILAVIFDLLAADTSAIWIASTGEVHARSRRPSVKPGEVSRTLIDQAVMSTQGVLVNDAKVDERLDRSKSVMVRGVQSAMAVPLRARSRTLGVLYVDSVSRSAAFTADDLALLEALGAQASLFLDNAELIAKVQQEAENRVNLSRFLSPAAVEEVLAGAGAVKLDGLGAEVTVLFADIRGFTALASSLRPEEVVAFLNQYFEQMVEAVMQHRGTVDKFIGDCIMAFWGAPAPTPQVDARNALAAALSMVERVPKVKVQGQPLEIGIGINTGRVVLGCIGSRQRVEYTAVGSAVNLAARLCGIARPNEVLVTADTLMRAGPGAVADANEPVLVKGFDVPVVPYTLRALSAPRAPIPLKDVAPAGPAKGRRK